MILLGAQIIAYSLGAIQHFAKTDNKLLRMLHYYLMTVLAQMVGAKRQAAGQTKPTWEAAESTR